MRQALARSCVALAAGLCLASSPAVAAHKSVLPEAARSAPGGRRVEVIVAQAELSSNINYSFAELAMGGGLVGVVIDAKVDSDREKRALREITPLRLALADFDADQLAIDTTRTALDGLPWFGAAQTPEFGRDPTLSAKAAVLSESPAGQVAFFEYVYDTSPDFSCIRVGVTITIANQGAQDGVSAESRLANRNLVYSQTLASVVRLSNPGSGSDNAARWTANGGALARKALTEAYQQIGSLIPRALTLTEDDVRRMSGGERKSVFGYGGWVQDDGPDGTLLFNGGLVHVRTLRE